MALRDKLRRLEKVARGKLGSFELADGSRYYFDPEDVYKETFKYFTDSMRADHRCQPRPEPPQVLQAVANARDQEAALSRVMGDYKLLPVSREALVERGEFAPHSLRASERQLEDAG